MEEIFKLFKESLEEIICNQKDKIFEKATNKSKSNGARIHPQLSCTISKEDKKLLDEFAIYASNKLGYPVTISAVVRACIRYMKSADKFFHTFKKEE